ncbi:ExbD/TolR family protein [Caballeronia insecticola]|uniref:Biopolymer transport protein ExbD/TolR n=1 Tax=Caballeronia insecticola TaxID=758793 RepID=R4WY21_9BURK|nr:biopolymer transporter ExbD [Caballeronia insecticola]BAN24076.1 biopolymer transport protein ExbD/TolR [Caballeronia insecticola]
MAFGGLENKPNSQPMADINMTPLIDVMLVLLVIFIITAPLFTHAIRLDLPKVASQPARETPQTVTLSIDDAGKLFWNDTPVSFEQMRTRFADAGKTAQPPELHLRASAGTRYDVIAQVMGAAQQAGLARIGFVTQPVRPPANTPAH